MPSMDKLFRVFGEENKTIFKYTLHKIECIFFMPRNQLNKEELITHIQKLMNSIKYDRHVDDPKSYAIKYLQYVIDKIDEYRF